MGANHYSLTTSHSPKTLIIKRGEHGLLMFQNDLSLPVAPKQSVIKKGLSRLSAALEARNDKGRLRVFNLPGYPLEYVVDPTGAGDTFAGGFFGQMAKTNNTSWANLKRACVLGSVMASFCVEKMGTKKLLDIGILDISKRLKDFERLIEIKSLSLRANTQSEADLPDGMT